MKVWDDDPEEGGDDFIDNFSIQLISSLFDGDQSNSQTVNGTEGIGYLTLAFYNLSFNPISCNAKDQTIISANSLLPGNYKLQCICLLIN